MNEELLRKVVQETGDAIADVLEMVAGKVPFTTDGGVDICDTPEMLALSTALENLGEFRSAHLNYTEWGTMK